ncbi:alpha/beta fold hydrolase [Verrucomicrobiaceae bacterium N1E253]|uniref:Alpha/beta fold hydrolase n=1 Tax=Oceaniferula marina TaxID=2748318 RepID=A0A851GJ24_9BACT|nr:alpha/beta fold hydrolase [Oceaniferula marina]NWK57179.1 alpha/beta fold hydrolase [Oceaniferula marina]
MIWALHGAVGRPADWLGLSDALRAHGLPLRGEVRRLDLWRFLDCCPMPLSQFGDTLASEIARVDDEPILIAYSMGGRLALHALIARPELWKAAVIISAHPGLQEESERAVRRAQDAIWSARALKGDWREFLEQWQAQSVLADGPAMPDRMQLKDRRTSVARSFVDWSLGAQQDLRPQLRAVSCPVLWLSGARDEKFTALAEEVVPFFQNASHQVLEDCGHRVPWEKSEAFAGVCVQWLEALAEK